MDCRIDKKIQFNGETKHSSLYKWCLNEVEADGKLSGDLIPWKWGFYFTASSLSVVREVAVDNRSRKEKNETTETTTIRGFLYSGGCWDGKEIEKYANFSMFGTNRIIKKFDLSIFQAEDGQDEGCSLWGCPSFEDEIDFRTHITEDDVIINVALNAKRFNEFVRLIEAKQVDFALVRIGQVAGFYSDWSPSVSTSHVKVLTDDHFVEGLEDSGIEPPKLGSVGQFSIGLHSINNLNAKLNLKAIDFYSQFDEVDEDDVSEKSGFLNQISFQQERVGNNPSREQELAFYAKLINTLKIPLWLIFIALILILAR